MQGISVRERLRARAVHPKKRPGTVIHAVPNQKNIKFPFEEIVLVDFRFGGRFPRACPNPPRRFAPAGIGLHAFPAGVAACTTIHSFLNKCLR